MRIDDADRMPASHLAPMLGVSRQMVVTWARRDGCPQNDDKTYRLKEVIAWRRERDIAESRGQAETVDSDVADQKHEKALLTKAQREIAQIDLQRKREEVLDKEQVRCDMLDIVTIARTNLLSLHDRLAVMVCPENPKPAAEMIRKEIHSVLTTMALGKGVVEPCEI